MTAPGTASLGHCRAAPLHPGAAHVSELPSGPLLYLHCFPGQASFAGWASVLILLTPSLPAALAFSALPLISWLQPVAKSIVAWHAAHCVTRILTNGPNIWKGSAACTNRQGRPSRPARVELQLLSRQAQALADGIGPLCKQLAQRAPPSCSLAQYSPSARRLPRACSQSTALPQRATNHVGWLPVGAEGGGKAHPAEQSDACLVLLSPLSLMDMRA